MMRRQLIQQLEQLDRPNPGKIFVLLWHFFRRVKLAGAENRLREIGEEKDKLQPYDHSAPCLVHAPTACDSLKYLLGAEEQFDLQALRWLKRLDRDLKADFKSAHDHVEHTGFDSSVFLLKARNNWIADHLVGDSMAKGPPGDKQGNLLTLLPYCLHFMAVATSPGSEQIECRSGNRGSRRWTTLELELLLRQERQGRRFSVLLWPFREPLSYAGVDLAALAPNPDTLTPVRLTQLKNEDAVCTEVLTAVAEARNRQATILLFPELSLPPRIATALQEELRRDTSSHRPLLTLFGACHVAQPGSNNDLNEAILLGPDGRELLRHRKLSDYIDDKKNGKLGERIDVGKTITILESPIGNLVPLVCLDSFHATVAETLRLCHGNTFLVPSLSPKTSAHRTAALANCHQRWVSTFVCNQWLVKETDQDRDDQSSFIQIGNSAATCIDHQTTERFLPFEKDLGYRIVRTPRFLFFELC